jgi:hypothetical protein
VKLIDTLPLGSTLTSSPFALPSNPVPAPCDILVAVVVDNGSGGAPSDAPIGTLSLQVQLDGVWSDFADINAALPNVSPNGNVAISRSVIVRGVMGDQARLVYTRTSGGGGNSRMSAYVRAA